MERHRSLIGIIQRGIRIVRKCDKISPSVVQRWNGQVRGRNFSSGRDREENIDSFGSWGWDSLHETLPLHESSIDKGQIIPNISTSSVGVSSMKGRRAAMEDEYGIEQLKDSILYFAVFDGHGGSACAKFCSLNFPRHLTYLFSQNMEPSAALHKAFLEVNNAFARYVSLFNRKNDVALHAGSTATVCLLTDSTFLHIGHVGDSRVLICRSGEPRKLTTDHIPSLITEKTRIEKSGGKCSRTRVNDRLAMTRSIGDLELKRYGVIAEPDVRTLKIDHSRDAFLVLTTDGINNVINDKEIIEAVKGTEDPKAAAIILTDTAFQYSSEDNSTAIVVPFGSWGKYSAAATIFHSFGKSFGSSSRFS